MTKKARFTAAVPVLASLDISRTVDFYVRKLGFRKILADRDNWGVVERDAIQIHFWHTTDRTFAENTSCRVRIENIEELHQELKPHGVIHPNGPLRDTEWGTREFDIVDLYGNLLTFFETT